MNKNELGTAPTREQQIEILKLNIKTLQAEKKAAEQALKPRQGDKVRFTTTKGQVVEAQAVGK